MLSCIPLHCIIYSVLHCTVLTGVVRRAATCVALHCARLHCAVLSYSVLHCTVLYCHWYCTVLTGMVRRATPLEQFRLCRHHLHPHSLRENLAARHRPLQQVKFGTSMVAIMEMPFTSTMTVMSMTLLHVHDEGYGSDLHVDADVMAVTFTSTMTIM